MPFAPGEDPNFPYWVCDKCGFSNSRPRKECIDCGKEKSVKAEKYYGRYGKEDKPFNGL